MGEDGTRPRARRSYGPAARLDPPAAVGGYRLLTPHHPVAGRVRQEGKGVGRPDARVTRGGAEAVPHAIRGDYGMDLRWRAQARPADGSPPLRQVAACRGEEGQAPKARRRPVASVPAEVGNGAKASLAQGCRRGGWVERHRDTPHLLSAGRCRHAVSSDERAEEDARRGARVRLTWPPRPPDPGQVVGETAPQTAPPLLEAQSTAGAIANGASR